MCTPEPFMRFPMNTCGMTLMLSPAGHFKFHQAADMVAPPGKVEDLIGPI